MCENCMSPNEEKRKALKPSLSKQMGKWGDDVHLILSHLTLDMGQCLFCEKFPNLRGTEDESGQTLLPEEKGFLGCFRVAI